MIQAFLGTVPSIPFYTCKHCKNGCYFLVHVGRFWMCKDCFKQHKLRGSKSN